MVDQPAALAALIAGRLEDADEDARPPASVAAARPRQPGSLGGAGA